MTVGWDAVRLKDSPLAGRYKRDAPGETGRLPCRESESAARERIDNQGIEECLNRAPRGTEGLREEAGRRHRVLRVPANGETVNTKSEQA